MNTTRLALHLVMMILFFGITAFHGPVSHDSDPFKGLELNLKLPRQKAKNKIRKNQSIVILKNLAQEQINKSLKQQLIQMEMPMIILGQPKGFMLNLKLQRQKAKNNLKQ